MSRFDNRTKEEFAKQVYFGTKVEKLFFELFLKSCLSKSHAKIYSHKDNGVCNDGSYVEGVNTSGADYKVDMYYDGDEYVDLPLEVKWVPTYGKLTLKVADLKAYKKERAAILFLYTSNRLDLRQPKDKNFEAYKALVLSKKKYLRWGIMMPNSVKEFLEFKKPEIRPISYMGNKPGIVLDQDEFEVWFKEEVL